MARATAIGAIAISIAAFDASAPPAAAAPGGDRAAMAAAYVAENRLWDTVSPLARCGDDRSCLRAGAGDVAEASAALVRPLVRALRTVATPCVVRTAGEALLAARLARTGARKTLKGSRNTSWPGGVIDVLDTLQMSADSCVGWDGGA